MVKSPMASPRNLTLSLLVLGLPVFAGSPVPGIKNFYQVDEHVYRGGQPTFEGFRYLAKIGVKCILDLRETDGRSREEERTVTGAGMRYINVPMTGLTPPTEREMATILALLEDAAGGPVFVHCKRGADRTGAVIGAYHVDHDKWDNARALKDAMSHGMSYFQLPRQRYIRDFRARTVDASAAAPGAPDGKPAAAAAPAIARD
jgi:tyrosine-protein phosphatase SIW14